MKDEERQEIFRQWLKQHRSLLFKVVRAYAFNLDDQDDLFQEISLQVWRSIPKFRSKSAVTTWLYRIALNTAIKWTAKEKRYQDKQRPIDHIVHTPHEHMKSEDERLTWLYEEIAKLDKVERSLTLLLLDGFRYKDMANILGISQNHVGVKINRIKKYLITQSKKYDYHGI